VARPHRLKSIEQEHNEPLDTLILRLLNEYGSIPSVARILNTTTQTIFVWCKRNHIEKRVIWTRRSAAPERSEIS
jgi:DNA invertase Pin-like site-specific DNA recombinase